MPEGNSLLGQVRVVLVETQDQVNLGAVIRAMKNMGVGRLRLVRPSSYDVTRIELVAHGTRDIAERIEHFDSVAAAIADCVHVSAYTARDRTAKRTVTSPRAASATALERAREGPVALLFGREDRGLANEDVDRANELVTIPTTVHASLNLAQAVMIALYELHVADASATREMKPPRKQAPPATAESYEVLFGAAESALEAIDFFRTRNHELILRTLRSLAFRAAPDAREIELLRAMAIEVVRTMQRIREGRDRVARRSERNESDSA